MPFQTQVNVVQAPAVEGDFADKNPRDTVLAGPGALVAGPAGAVIGRFCWADANNLTATNSGVGAPTGFLANTHQALITAFLAEFGMTVPSGVPLTLFSAGAFWAKNAGSGAASIGQKAYANNATGAISFAATATPPAGASVTGSIAANVVTGAVVANAGTAAIAANLMTVSAITAGSVFGVGEAIAGANVQPGTVITSFGTGAGGVGTYNVNISQTAASAAITGSNSGLTVSAVTTGGLSVGETISGTSVTSGSKVLAIATGTGGVGTFTVSGAYTASSTTITGTFGTMTVSAVASGALAVNDPITGTNVTGTPYIVAFKTGTGGTGTYIVSVSETAASATITVNAATETKWIAASAGAAGELVKLSSHILG